MIKFFVPILLVLQSCQSLEERPTERDLAGVYYRVKPKDTIASIAQKHRLTAEEIKDVNGIDDERSLRVGQALFLPDPDPIGKRIAKLKPTPAPHKKTSPKKVAAAHQVLFDFPLKNGTIVHNFSTAKQNPYDGIGIKALLGEKVLAAQSGQVLFVGDDGTRFGLLVIVEHKDPFITVYTQLDKALVKAGQHLKKGQPLGLVGKSGGAQFAHLHFQVRLNRKPVDPKAYLKSYPGRP